MGLSLLNNDQHCTMNNLTGWAAGLWAKQKMGGIGQEADTKPMEAPEMRKSLAAQRAERDAEYEKRKAERAAKKGSIAEKWKAQKESQK